MSGSTRHVCRDQHDEPIRGGDRKHGEKKGHLPGCTGEGVWSYAIRCPTKTDPYAYLRRAGFEYRKDADAELRKVVTLLDLVPRGDGRRAQIGQAIHDATRQGGTLNEAEVRRKVDARRDPSQPTPTVSQWCDEFMAGRGHIRRGTRAGWQRRIRNYIAPHLGSLPLDALTKVHVRAMFDAIERRAAGEPLDDDPPDERGRRSVPGPPLQHQVLSLLRSIIKSAVDERVIAHNPLAGFRLEGYDTPERRVWSLAQVDTFITHVEGDRLAALFRVAVLHGLRKGELLGLRWEDLDLDASTLAVRQQVGWFGSTPSVGPLKTKRSRRSFSIDAGTVAALKQHRRDQREERMRAGPAWQGAEWNLVFCQEDGTPLRPYAPNFALKRLAQEAGLPERTMHELRHTAITRMLVLGINPKVVSERAGHATVAMTLDLYGHVLAEQDQDAADRIGASAGRLR